MLFINEELSRWLRETPERNLETLKRKNDNFRLNIDNLMDTQENTRTKNNSEIFETRKIIL
jgi:hypothetical protein